MTGRVVDFGAVLRDMDIEREMEAAQARLVAEEPLEARMNAALEIIRSAPHSHGQSNLLVRRAAVASERRFATEPESLTGFGGLEHKAYLIETGEWQQDGEQELRDLDSGATTPWGDVE